ncbi:PREDICTED: uncharacterized protein LOC105364257 [Ceratosolen solmsi marchali]|uniref:Uncharacterized protein LOC105364257 n=1 Tax=Ceratosolen solmsi marchali TaxID=326594 RepID=A0AAJ7DXX2_9HYME|nr:PREDICTED: uncharacterized protein LOC105364257 [Ceratosolen solmsi marchali]
MSDGAGPSTSRVAMSIAFKRARRKFPKNFGLSFNTDETHQTAQNEDLPLDLSDSPELPINYNDREKVVSDQIEESLVNSLQEIEVTDKRGATCDQYDRQSKDFENVDGGDGALVDARQSDKECDRQSSIDNIVVNNK